MLTWLSSFASSESPLAEVTTTVFNIACITGHVCTWSVPAFAPSARHSATVGGDTTSHTELWHPSIANEWSTRPSDVLVFKRLRRRGFRDSICYYQSWTHHFKCAPSSIVTRVSSCLSRRCRGNLIAFNLDQRLDNWAKVWADQDLFLYPIYMSSLDSVV